MEEKKYPIGGYAPGNYTCKCCICKQEFQGDKRAVQCESCAKRATSGESDARATQPSFNEMVGLIKKLFTDYLEDVLKSKPEEIEKSWERYKVLNHLYQDEIPQPRPRWVKASERLPKNPDDPNNHYRLKGHRVTGNFYEDCDKMVCFEVRGTTHGAYSISSKLFHYLEWLDESSAAAREEIKFDSNWLIGRSEDRFKELEHKRWDWRSFYNGWIEGRSDAWDNFRGRESAVEFAEWIRKEAYQNAIGIWNNGFQRCDGGKEFTTAQLYELFKQQKEK